MNDPGHTNVLLNHIFNYVNYALFALWFFVCGRDAMRSDELMGKTADKHDKDGKFLRKFGINLYSLGKPKHELSQEFLDEWDAVYGAYWRRNFFYIAVLIFYGVFAGLVRQLINFIFHP
jgi:hypothetical protein